MHERRAWTPLLRLLSFCCSPLVPVRLEVPDLAVFGTHGKGPLNTAPASSARSGVSSAPSAATNWRDISLGVLLGGPRAEPCYANGVHTFEARIKQLEESYCVGFHPSMEEQPLPVSARSLTLEV